MIHATEHKSAAPLTLTDATSPWHLPNSELRAGLCLKDVTGSVLRAAIHMINTVTKVSVLPSASLLWGALR